MTAEVRRECKQCGVHTFGSACGNCGSTELRKVRTGDAGKAVPRRFAQRLAGAVGGRGLRSGSVS